MANGFFDARTYNPFTGPSAAQMLLALPQESVNPGLSALLQRDAQNPYGRTPGSGVSAQGVQPASAFQQPPGDFTGAIAPTQASASPVFSGGGLGGLGGTGGDDTMRRIGEFLSGLQVTVDPQAGAQLVSTARPRADDPEDEARKARAEARAVAAAERSAQAHELRMEALRRKIAGGGGFSAAHSRLDELLREGG